MTVLTLAVIFLAFAVVLAFASGEEAVAGNMAERTGALALLCAILSAVLFAVVGRGMGCP